MNSFKPLKPEFSLDAFAGTAEYYSRYRIPYPDILIEDLIKRSSPPPQGKLLDIASGPGRVALQLAPFFSKVIANDINPEMVSVGKSEAWKRRIENIEWLIGRAEELNIEPDSIDLVTIGEAFHRLDRNLITNLSLRWLKSGCHIAIMGCYGLWNGKEPWQNITKNIVSKWASKQFPGDEKSEAQRTVMGPEHYKLILQEKGFIECNIYSFVIPHYWTSDSIIGNLYSTSFCSKKVLGDKVSEFETELKSELNRINKEGRFFENIKCGYTLGMKPLSE